jgi:hypothetical protein
VFYRKGYKVNMNRFWHGVEVGWIYAKNWSKMRFAHTFMALESPGTLDNATLAKLVFKPGIVEATKAEHTSVEEKALRGKINALACSVLFLGERQNLPRLRAILVAASPVGTWFRAQASKCRSMEDNATWLQEQLGGDFMQHIFQVWMKLTPQL